MILYTNIVKISKNRWIGYMLKVAFLMASSIFQGHPRVIILSNFYWAGVPNATYQVS